MGYKPNTFLPHPFLLKWNKISFIIGLSHTIIKQGQEKDISLSLGWVSIYQNTFKSLEKKASENPRKAGSSAKNKGKSCERGPNHHFKVSESCIIQMPLFLARSNHNPREWLFWLCAVVFSLVISGAKRYSLCVIQSGTKYKIQQHFWSDF